ncbi:hypothetical protein DFH06DRAFT_1148841 [Mycena polygramma]|nr:hypothetical protein DFH06DRAFT_1148841 [Mycena polygramma]
MDLHLRTAQVTSSLDHSAKVGLLFEIPGLPRERPASTAIIARCLWQVRVRRVGQGAKLGDEPNNGTGLSHGSNDNYGEQVWLPRGTWIWATFRPHVQTKFSHATSVRRKKKRNQNATEQSDVGMANRRLIRDPDKISILTAKCDFQSPDKTGIAAPEVSVPTFDGRISVARDGLHGCKALRKLRTMGVHTIHSADAALGTVRFAHLPAGSFLVLLPKDEPVKIFHNHVEIGLRAYKLFNELADEKKLLASAVASLNTVRRKGKVDFHILELPEDDDSEE